MAENDSEKSKRRVNAGRSRAAANRWRFQDAQARFGELVWQAQQCGPQQVTLRGRDAVVVVRVDEFDRMQRQVSGRDIVTALASSPLADVIIERHSIAASSKTQDS